MKRISRRTISKYVLLLVLPYLFLTVGDSFLHAFLPEDASTHHHSDNGMHSPYNGDTQSNSSHIEQVCNDPSHNHTCAACLWAKSAASAPQTIFNYLACSTVISSHYTPIQYYHHDLTVNTSSRAPPTA
ncbi:MAG: hypothetical protein ACYC0V_03775 [Armatimonadota bacterium]